MRSILCILLLQFSLSAKAQLIENLVKLETYLNDFHMRMNCADHSNIQKAIRFSRPHRLEIESISEMISDYLPFDNKKNYHSISKLQVLISTYTKELTIISSWNIGTSNYTNTIQRSDLLEALDTLSANNPFELEYDIPSTSGKSWQSKLQSNSPSAWGHYEGGTRDFMMHANMQSMYNKDYQKQLEIKETFYQNEQIIYEQIIANANQHYNSELSHNCVKSVTTLNRMVEKIKLQILTIKKDNWCDYLEYSGAKKKLLTKLRCLVSD